LFGLLLLPTARHPIVVQQALAGWRGAARGAQRRASFDCCPNAARCLHGSFTPRAAHTAPGRKTPERVP
jgi:hypothetical protein